MCSRLALSFVLIGLVVQHPPHAVAQHAFGAPKLVLWAWERPEDLRNLEPSTGVAFLAQSVSLSGRLRVTPRRHQLRVNAGARLIAVTRIEADRGAATLADPSSLPTIADVIAHSSRLPRVVGVQVDFDARASERAFYHGLLDAIRARIGTMPLSMTALASWCGEDSWLDTLPVDEAVPMLFRMGPFNEPFRRAAAKGQWSAARCNGSVGTSIDEPASLRVSADRVYVFNPRSWSDGAISHVRARFGS